LFTSSAFLFLLENDTGGVYKHLLSDSDFCENQHLYCLIGVKLDLRDWHAVLLSIDEFHENWYREGHAFLVGKLKVFPMHTMKAYRGVEV
jgi:hypothetical protein